MEELCFRTPKLHNKQEVQTPTGSAIESICPLNDLQPLFGISYSFGAMPRSILAKLWYPNLKMSPFTALVLDTYGVMVSSPKQFDFDRSKSKVTETAR